MAEAARGLVKQAEQKMQSGFLRWPKYDEAQELYQSAANQFKLAKEWQEAADCFSQCAFCAQKGGSTSDEANFLQEAGNVLKKISTSLAVEKYEGAIAILNANGRFSQSAKLLLQIAELYEAERLDNKQVREYYKRAAEMFDMDDYGKSNLSKCNLKVAEYAAKDGDLPEAIRLFEQEGEKALQNTLLQYGAKEHFLRAGILHLAVGDSVTANIAVDKYCCLDPRFKESREGELLQNLAKAFETSDGDLFQEKITEYDSMTRLDPWKTEFLLQVKEHISPSGANAMSAALDLT